MILNEFAYFLVLTAVVVLALATLYLNIKLVQRSLFDNVMAGFLLFSVVHCFYACFARYFFKELSFVDIGAPFILFYPSFFYISLMALKRAPNWKWSKIVIHLIPALLFVIAFVFLVLDHRIYEEYNMIYLITLYLFAGLQFISYAVYGFVKFNKALELKEFKLVTNYSIKLMVLVFLVFLSLVFDSALTEEKSYDNAVVVYFFILLIVIVVFRYHVVVIVKGTEVIVEDVPFDVRIAVTDREVAVKYEKSRINEQEGLVYLVRLNQLMEEEKLYLIPELTIGSLSKRLKITKHHLTQVFTIMLGTNFNKHVNQYRVMHAATLLEDLDRKVSIGDIGTESGFNSRTSFYRGFKTHYGVSPADYRKSLSAAKKARISL